MSLNNKGYSLIELLLVLMIVFVISSSALYLNNRYVEKYAFELFYNQFVLDVRHVQTTALNERRSAHLIFDYGGTEYIGRKSLTEPLFVKKLPTGYSLSQSSTIRNLFFQPNGTLEKFGTLIFNTPSGIKRVRIYIGKGRMTLEQ